MTNEQNIIRRYWINVRALENLRQQEQQTGIYNHFGIMCLQHKIWGMEEVMTVLGINFKEEQ